LLALPRLVGPHPETGQPIRAGIGRYGPFVQHERTFANLDTAEEVFSVGLNRAVSLIAEKLAGGGRRGRAVPRALKTLGDHPDGGGVSVRDGRYGPYVNHGKTNATLPKDMDPESVTLETALELLAARAGKAPSRGRARAQSKPKSKARSKPKTMVKARPKGPAGARPTAPGDAD
jgi:DNA topoisomerase-1